jgi:hypothetical protein
MELYIVFVRGFCNAFDQGSLGCQTAVSKTIVYGRSYGRLLSGLVEHAPGRCGGVATWLREKGVADGI